VTTTVTEKQLQSDIIRIAKAAGWKVYHTHDSRRSEFGFPDLTMVRRGRLIFAEIKRELGKPTPEQSEWLEALSVVPRIEVFIWRPQDWTEIEGVLK
jgi:hypothetical protein